MMYIVSILMSFGRWAHCQHVAKFICRSIQMLTPVPTHACSRAFQQACWWIKQLSLCIINGRNVMTDDSEQPIPPPSLAQRCLLGFHGSEKRQRSTQFDWLILSSRLLPSMLSSASVSPSHYQHDWEVTGHLRHSCPPLSIFFSVQLVWAPYHQPRFVYSNDSSGPFFGKMTFKVLTRKWAHKLFLLWETCLSEKVHTPVFCFFVFLGTITEAWKWWYIHFLPTEGWMKRLKPASCVCLVSNHRL